MARDFQRGKKMKQKTNWKLQDHDVKHLSYYYKGDVSKLGRKVLKFCAIVFGGLHNTPDTVLEKTDWSNNHHIKINTFYSFSTYDDDRLTTLVLLAHDLAVRIEIQPCNFRYFSMLFHQRKRTGDLYHRHPTIEKVLKEWRKTTL